MASLSPIQFTGADVLRDGALSREPLILRDGRIGSGDAPEIDLSGYLILPGLVDLNMGPLHRPGQPGGPSLDHVAALRALDREAAAHGIMTGWVAQGWSWLGGHHAPQRALDVMAALEQVRGGTMTDLRLQLRVETHMPDTRAALIAALTAHEVDQVILTNTLPEAIQMSHRASHLFAAWAETEGRTPEEVLKRLRAAKDAAPDVPRHLLALAEAFDARGIVYGSHDDPDGETREQMGQLGARVAEFPLRAGAAAVARANRNPIVFCAADVLRAGPRPGGVSTMALITKGKGDALASRDHPATLAAAAFALVEAGVRSLPEAWAMVSARPAAIMGLPDRGRIAMGLRADLVLLNTETRGIEGTFAGGRVAFLSGALAHRFLASRAELALAAE
jgi:alpha-D-ribose 1-methylphosphonate 5-triphosphate diphosphatase